jgi:hypothetical protein
MFPDDFDLFAVKVQDEMSNLEEIKPNFGFVYETGKYGLIVKIFRIALFLFWKKLFHFKFQTIFDCLDRFLVV